MKKRPKIVKVSAGKSRRLLAITIILAATAVIATGAATVVSRQKAGEQSSGPVGKAPATSANRSYVTVKVAGQEVQVDSQTGRMKELTLEEAQRLAGSLRQEINQSTEGLVPVRQADGSVTMNIDGRFQSVTVARRNDDGSLSTACVDNARSAGEFFGIDPQMIENGPDGNRTGVKRPRAVRSTNQDK